MSMHLHKFVDRLRGFEARGARDFTMSINDAKDLHADITRLLLDLQALKETAIKQANQDDTTISVEIQGGTFK
jgi:hypothetical protein